MARGARSEAGIAVRDSVADQLTPAERQLWIRGFARVLLAQARRAYAEANPQSPDRETQRQADAAPKNAANTNRSRGAQHSGV
jgi:hypothetical protein